MALPSYDDLVKSDLPSYDELTRAQTDVPPEIAQSEAQQAIEQNFRAPQWANNAAEALQGTLGGFIPRSMHDVAGLLTPATGSIDEVIKAARIAKDVANGATPEEATRRHSPESFQLADAQQTPPYSKERFQAGFDTVAQMLMAAGIAKGHAKAGEVPKEAAQPSGVLPSPETSVDRGPLQATPDQPAQPSSPVENRPFAETAIARDVPQVPQSDVNTPPVEPSTIRLYHGGSESAGQAGSDFSPFKDYAQGYADKSPDGVVWYVDVPKDMAVDEYGVPRSRVVLSDQVANKAKVSPREAPSVQAGNENQGAPPVSKDSGIKEPQAVPVDVQGQTTRFVPSTEWQEVPPGTVLPNGGEYRMDQKSGKNFARWKAENLPPGTPVENAPDKVQHGEFPQEGYTATDSPVPTARTPDSSDTTGIAQATHDKRGIAVEPGAGVGAEDMVNRGRQLVANGVDPVQRLQEMKASGRINGDDIAVLRARHEELGKATNAAEDTIRSNPSDPMARKAYEAAWKAENDWAKEIKPFQTEWHKIGMAQQGETSLDTGSFSGLRRAVVAEKGRDVFPHEAPRLQEAADRVQAATRAEAVARKRLSEAVDGMTKKTRMPATREELAAHFADKFKKMLPC